MRVAVVGSRKYENYLYFCERVDYFIQNIEEEIEFVSGGCKTGADSLIVKYCKDRGLQKPTEFKPEYDKYPENPKKAPVMRNKTIAEYCDVMIAFWDNISPGTKTAIDFARKENKPVRIVDI